MIKITFLAGPSTVTSIVRTAQEFPPEIDVQVVVLPLDIPESSSNELLRQMLESAGVLIPCPPHLMRPYDYDKFIRERGSGRRAPTPEQTAAIFDNLARHTYERLKQSNDPLARILNPQLRSFNNDEVRGPGDCARLAVMRYDDIRCLLLQLAKHEGKPRPEDEASKELRELDALFASRFGIGGFCMI